MALGNSVIDLSFWHVCDGGCSGLSAFLFRWLSAFSDMLPWSSRRHSSRRGARRGWGGEGKPNPRRHAPKGGRRTADSSKTAGTERASPRQDDPIPHGCWVIQKHKHKFQNSKLQFQNSKITISNSKLQFQNSKLQFQNSKLQFKNLILPHMRPCGLLFCTINMYCPTWARMGLYFFRGALVRLVLAQIGPHAPPVRHGMYGCVFPVRADLPTQFKWK